MAEETTVDERGRILIPQETRERLGLDKGIIVKVAEEGREIIIKPLSRKHGAWKDLCGIKPQRTGKPEWPTAEEIKSIWE
ncbi:MAG: AbrB/MazE/SpoVT family DNA-binding domain-containing protein [Candidatus Bathyarchaeia archaeon]